MGNDLSKLPGVFHKGLDRSLYEGTYISTPRILDPDAPCPHRSYFGLKPHRLNWKTDHIAVCRDCGGYYEEETT